MSTLKRAVQKTPISDESRFVDVFHGESQTPIVDERAIPERILLKQQRAQYERRLSIGVPIIWLVPIFAYEAFAIKQAIDAGAISVAYVIFSLILSVLIALIPASILTAIFVALLKRFAGQELKDDLAQRAAKETLANAERRRRDASKRAEKEQQRRDPAAFERNQKMGAYLPKVHELLTAPLTRLGAVSVRVNEGESVYWSEPCDSYLTAKKTTREGFVPGMSVRVARGLWLRTPSSHVGTTVSLASQKQDEGSLFITDQRVLFVGLLQSFEIPLAKIISLDPFEDGMRLSILDSKTRTFVTGNPQASAVLARVVEGTQNERVPEPEEP